MTLTQLLWRAQAQPCGPSKEHTHRLWQHAYMLSTVTLTNEYKVFYLIVPCFYVIVRFKLLYYSIRTQHTSKELYVQRTDNQWLEKVIRTWCSRWSNVFFLQNQYVQRFLRYTGCVERSNRNRTEESLSEDGSSASSGQELRAWRHRSIQRFSFVLWLLEVNDGADQGWCGARIQIIPFAMWSRVPIWCWRSIEF